MSMKHFSFVFSDPGPQQTKVASERLELLAKIAAKRYLEEGAPLNSSIKKIAEENDLNPNQIERVCEMANINTHKGLWSKTAQKESIAFDLADSRNIVSGVRRDPEAINTGSGCGCGSEPCQCSAPAPAVNSPCSSDSDYMGPPRGVPRPGPSLISMMGADPAQVHHGLGPLPEKKKIIIVIEKKAAQYKKLKSEVIYKGMELETLEKQAFGKVKQSVLGGETFARVFEAACGAGLAKVANEYLPKFQEQLIQDTHGSVRTRLEKCAIHKAPAELISDNLGGTVVVNGAHPVIVSLDTIQRKTGEIKNLLNNLLRIDDEVKIYRQRIKEL
jgi:hypothetical protein